MQYLSLLPRAQNAHNLDVGRLDLFFSCLNAKQAKRLQNCLSVSDH